ncbi:MAG: Calx-beta domain-containing protein, partial [Planctomycetota bacterium]
MSVEPFDFGGGVSLGGTVGFGVFEYEETLVGGSTQTSTSWFLSIEGELGFASWAIEAEMFLTESGPVAIEIGANLGAAGIALGSSGLAIKSLSGRAVRDIPTITNPNEPLDLLNQSTSDAGSNFLEVIDPDADSLIEVARKTAEKNSQSIAEGNGPIDFLDSDFLFAFGVGIGLAGDPTDTLLIETTLGAIVSPPPASPDDEFGLQIFGLAEAILFPNDNDKRVDLGRAGLLIDFSKPARTDEVPDPDLTTTVTFAFEVGTDSQNSSSSAFQFPAEIRVGGQFRGTEDRLEIKLQGEVNVDGLLSSEAGGVLVFARDEGFYGAIGATIEIDGGGILDLDGELFVTMNNTGTIQSIPFVDAGILPQKFLELDDAEDDNPNDDPAIPTGFDLFAAADLDILGFIELSGRLRITVLEDEWSAALNVEGSLFGELNDGDPDDGIVKARLGGTIEVDTSGEQSRIRSLEIGGSASVVLIEDFLEAEAMADLSITNDRFRSLSGSVEATLFGFELGGTAAINEHGCLTLAALPEEDSEEDTQPIDVPLFPGACTVVGEVPPMRIEVGNVARTEGQTGEGTFRVPVTFTDKIPYRLESGTEQELVLEYWTMQRPDRDSATPDVDFEKVEQKTFRIPLTEIPIGTTGDSFYLVPDEVTLPVTVFGDRLVEDDERFSVFVNVRQLDEERNPIGRVDDGFGRVTIINDDVVPEPPSDAVVFFDFDEEVTDESGTVIAIDPETTPDRSRPQLTFDIEAVSEVGHTQDVIAYEQESGLPTDFGLGRAASAETWDLIVGGVEGDPSLNPVNEQIRGNNPANDLSVGGGFGLEEPSLGGDGVADPQFFEFTITIPELTINEDGSKTGLNIAGIDFWNVADFGFLANPGQWKVSYDLDGYRSVLASGTIFVGDVFGHERQQFRFPPIKSATMRPGREVTFRISGPRTQIAGLKGTTQDLRWRIDNLALFGAEYTIPAPTVNVETEFSDSEVVVPDRFDPIIIDLPEEDPSDDLKPVLDPDTVKPVPIVKPPILPVKIQGSPKFFKHGGLETASVVYFDANLSGTLDEGEPQVTTDAAGRGEVFVDATFDTNGNGRIDLTEGILRSIGGEDLGTGLDQEIEFTAPFGTNAVSPLTSLATTLAIDAEIDAELAAQRVVERLRLGAVSIGEATKIFIDQLMLDANVGDPNAVDSYNVLVALSNLNHAFAEFLSSESLTSTQAGRAVVLSIARVIANENDELDLANESQLAGLLRDSATALNVVVDSDQVNAVARVVARVNANLSQLEEPIGPERVKAIKRTQGFLRTEIQPAIAEMIATQLPPDEFEQRFTTDAIRVAADVFALDDLFPVSIAIRDVTQSEPVSGSTQFEFLVRLSEPSPREVTIDYQTIGRSAQSGLGDFEASEGTLVFAPGERDKLISITVNADEIDELGEVFLVELTNPVRTLLADDIGVGTILIPNRSTPEPVLPSQIRVSSESIGLGNLYEFESLLPNIVSAEIDFGDGKQSQADLESLTDGVRVSVDHRYESEGTFTVVATLESASGQVVTIRQEVEVQASQLTEDPAFPGQQILTLAGTPQRDHVLVRWNSETEEVTAWLNGANTGTYSA